MNRERKKYLKIKFLVLELSFGKLIQWTLMTSSFSFWGCLDLIKDTSENITQIYKKKLLKIS